MGLSTFRNDPFLIGHRRLNDGRLARAREGRLSAGPVFSAAAVAILASGLALAMAVCWIAIVDHTALAALLAPVLP
jgi:hypothetical protein